MTTTKRIDSPRAALLADAIEHYGVVRQQMKAVEELSELIRALARADDPDNIAEEMADVRIMLDQLEIIFGNHLDVRRHEIMKLERLAARINAEG